MKKIVLERVLVVDDVEANRDILTRKIAPSGCEVVEASGGAEALKLLDVERFDVVLLDITMPEIDGFEVLRRVRLRYSQEELPVIMVTANTENHYVVRALKLGANDYITKPIVGSVVLARMESHLSRSRANNRLSEKVNELEIVNQQLELETLNRKRIEEKAQYLSFHDQLTGLGNWSFLEDRLQRTLRQERLNSTCSLSMIIDIDDFSAINEQYGHDAADSVLVDLSEQLSHSLGEDTIIARIGSNRFYAVIPGFADHRSATVRGESIALYLTEQKIDSICDPKFQLTIGLGVSPRDGTRTDEIVENVNSALTRARSNNQIPFCFFDSEMDLELMRRRELKADLQNALVNGEFELYFQPIWGASTKAIVGREALLRWNHPTRGLVSPADFIPLAEETRLIVRIGEWALREACQIARSAFPNQKMAVNISPAQFSQANFVQMVVAAISQSGIRPSNLELELTESILINSVDEATQKLRQLKTLGVRICLDDFGTGYSSLSYLRNFPVDKIKIDQSFTKSLFSEQSSRPIVAAIINMAKQLQLTITAEGIETEDQMQWMLKNGSNEFQGYLISKPLPYDGMTEAATGSTDVAVA